jgi:hypothetical protein
MKPPKTEEVRYPVVAIPKRMFHSLNAAIHKDPTTTETVNTVIQGMLRDVDRTFVKGSGVAFHVWQPPRSEDWNIDVGEVMRVRVTAEQFRLLREVQSEYYKLGHRISISCILGAVLARLDKRCNLIIQKRWESGDHLNREKHAYVRFIPSQTGLSQVKWDSL